MAIRLRGTGRAFTDRVQGLSGDSVDDVFPSTWMPAGRKAARTVGTLRLPASAATKSPAGGVNHTVALYSSLAGHAQSVPADLPKTGKREPTGQATRLAAWEDEGGATACVT